MIHFAAVIAVVLSTFAAPAEPITVGTLIAGMSDLEALTRHPGPGVRVVQFSSYDRRSNLPGGPDWFGNSDGFGNEPIPGFEAVIKEPGADGIGEYLLCDIQQPGAIVRTWTAAIEGTIRMYLDGSVQPIYDGPAVDFLMHRATWVSKSIQAITPQTIASFTGPFEQRYADYFPIPFTKSCRIVWVGNLKKVHFYHVQFKLYPAGTPVTTFELSDAGALWAIATKARTMLASGLGAGASVPHRAEFSLSPGETKEFLKLDAPGAITTFQARLESADTTEALRATLLKISFDGHQSAHIVSPVGDFFGAAPGVVPYTTFPMYVDPDGKLSCRFVMPYARSAVITIENLASVPVKLTLAVHVSPYTWDDRSMHFRARWRADHDLTARGGKDAVDLPFLAAHGQGVYVGTAVYIMNPCPVPTAGGNWWGEGDEKIFVDGEARPSIFGTGSEDYFNYAWSEGDIFQYPYFAQPLCTGPDTRGWITNNRWHILDAIPFDRSLSFFMELFSHTGTPHLSYARVAYWYAKPGAYDGGPAINTADLRVPPLPAWTVRAAGGATGAVMLEAESNFEPGPNAVVVEEQKYSAGKLVRFSGNGTILLSTEKSGKTQIVLTCASGPEKCVFVAKLNGAALKRTGNERVELQTAHIERLVNVWFEPVELAAGQHTLTLEGIEGSVGVDFVWVKGAK